MSTPKLVHYHAPQTRSFAIRWLLEELGSPPHELKVLNMKKGEHKTPEYLAINPMGKVPAITHGGIPVTEVGAIAIYLADLFPEAKLAPPIGDTARGTYLRWIVFNHGAIEPAITDHWRKIEPSMASSLSYGTYDDTVNALLGAVGKGPFILGDRFSAADVVIGSAVRWMTLFKLLPEKPEFSSYIERLTSRPAFKSALAKDEELVKALAS
ncbi:glutathione S-transferase family protein [Hyphomicrobium sp.]|uniref:glutathione S-transferase family protein n=1 Tax=Hyphomicrobium sp. TaxID=82 RepID=UPI000F9E66FC|nr:glutathione S-transferase family protein [Hyphomicrobium sp.]RUP09385.1 MAG: glutathione S-transferase family protein [Hyphomicrobium sp.]